MNNLVNTGDCETKSFVTIDPKAETQVSQPLTCDACRLPNIKYDKDASKIQIYNVLTKDIYGTLVYFPIDATFELSIDSENNVLHATAYFDIDMGHAQLKFAAIAAKLNRQDDCGDNFSLSNVSLVPTGENAEMQARARYAKWVCTYADLPQITCEDTWIDVPGVKTKGIPACNTTCEDTWIYGRFGLKTKGIPACSLHCEDTWIETPGFKTKGIPKCTNHGMKTVRTSENRLVEQSGSLTVLMSPSVSGADIQITPTVTDVHLDGFGQTFADLMRINVKNIAQHLLDSGIDRNQLSLAMPDEVRDFVSLTETHFYTGGDGGLRLVCLRRIRD